MFAGFNLKIGQSFFNNKFEHYKEVGENHLNAYKATYKTSLTSYILDTTVDGTKVQNDWFPEITADIFLSHSHNDEELAQALAGWLYETFGLHCFIDSNVWGYADHLLEKLNSKFSNKCEKDGQTYYDHKCCNKVSQHVNNMLTIALQKMIDKTEAIILLNTDNSIKFTDDKKIDLTYSPWIYSEIICTQIVRRKPLVFYRNYPFLWHHMNESTTAYKNAFYFALTVSYELSLNHLKKLNGSQLKNWRDRYNNAYNQEYPLDYLYEQHYPKELNKAKTAFRNLNARSMKAIKECFSGDFRDSDMIREKYGDLLLGAHCYCPVCNERNCRYMAETETLSE